MKENIFFLIGGKNTNMEFFPSNYWYTFRFNNHKISTLTTVIYFLLFWGILLIK